MDVSAKKEKKKMEMQLLPQHHQRNIEIFVNRSAAPDSSGKTVKKF